MKVSLRNGSRYKVRRKAISNHGDSSSYDYVKVVKQRQSPRKFVIINTTMIEQRSQWEKSSNNKNGSQIGSTAN